MKKTILCLLLVCAASVHALGQTASGGASVDPLGRSTPQGAILGLFEAVHARDDARAIRYLDVRQMSPEQRAREAPLLARQLVDILDNGVFEIASLNRDPLGELSDGLPVQRERIASFNVGGHMQELQLERTELKSGARVWLVPTDSIALIPQLHRLITETAFERRLPQLLVTTELFATPLWKWIALTALAIALWYGTGLVLLVGVRAFAPLFDAVPFQQPVRACIAAAVFRATLYLAAPSPLPRLYLERLIELALLLSLAWACGAAVDLLTERWRSRLDQRAQSMSYSVLPLGRQVIKLSLLLLAALSALSQWGYNMSAILAGMGVGGLAIALAAQKTIENLFGGISVIGDRPVLVGDFCRFGTHVGTVMHIGLRSTRIRTLDRTVISVPNSQFSAMELENFSARDKIWFHQTLSVRRDTTAQQMARVLDALGELLREHPRVEIGAMPVRFVGAGPSSLDIELFAYVLTPDYDAFLAVQQQLLLDVLKTLETAGTALAVPLVEQVQPLREEIPLRARSATAAHFPQPGALLP